MHFMGVNLWAVLACALATMVAGFLWYSPALFGARWSALTGVSPQEMQSGIVRALVPDVIGSALMAFVLLHAVHYAGANTLVLGAAVGFLNWLGFVATPSLGAVTFEKRPFALWAVNNSYLVIALVVMGAILAIWP